MDTLLECLCSINPAAPILLSGRDGPVSPHYLFGDTNADAGVTFSAIPPLAHRPICRGTGPDHANRYATFGSAGMNLLIGKISKHGSKDC